MRGCGKRPSSQPQWRTRRQIAFAVATIGRRRQIGVANELRREPADATATGQSRPENGRAGPLIGRTAGTRPMATRLRT